MSDAFVHTNNFDAPVARVYAAIADSTEHTAFTGAPAKLSTEPGEVFETHGGAIEGRTLAAEQDVCLVQAWRPADWPPGVFSIVRYDFAADGDGTTLTLTHTAIPDGAAEHLSTGWNENYWTPLTEYLAD